MELIFLAAKNTPLTKTFSQDAAGNTIKKSYPRVHRFTSHRERITSIETFYKALEKHARQFHCLLKGTLVEDIDNESRAGRTTRNEPTDWVCLDIDGIPELDSPEQLLAEIREAADVSHIVQYSSSMGVDPDKGLSAHVFMLLDRPMEPRELKTWLYNLNLTLPILRDNIRMNRLGTCLVWPLDVTTCQNDKLIYIAPPICSNGAKDHFRGDRIQLIKGRRGRRLSPITSDIDPRWIERERRKLLNEHRKAANLPPKAFTEKVVGGVPVSSKPDAVEITDMKIEREFVYFNFNGGDSWAYYHPITNPDVIYNFKGEPNYLTKDISAEYHKQAQVRAREIKEEYRTQEINAKLEKGEGRIYLAFRDERSDQYFVGWFDPASDYTYISQTGNLTKLQHFLMEHEQPVPEAIPTWRYEFKFDESIRIDFQEKYLNKYVPTDLIGLPKASKPRLPPTIEKIIESFLNDSNEIKEHFLNWMACIYQHRTKTMTAWILHGVEGTGKNIFFDKVLRPIFGTDSCLTMPLNSLEDNFNQHLEQAIFVMFNEADIEETKNQKKVQSRLREVITDSPLSIRPMRGNWYNATSYANVLLASNQPVSVTVGRHDRRYNVARWQPKRLFLTQKEIKLIDEEVAGFAGYLASRSASMDKATQLLDTEDRRKLQEISANSTDETAQAILDGDLDFFFSALPEHKVNPGENPFWHLQLDAFKQILAEATEYVLAREEHILTRDQLHTLLRFCIDNIPASPHKFTKFLKYHGVYTRRLRKDSQLIYGIKVNWKVSPEIKTELKKLIAVENSHVNS